MFYLLHSTYTDQQTTGKHCTCDTYEDCTHMEKENKGLYVYFMHNCQSHGYLLTQD